jgi:hypothetical protein
VVGYLKIDGGRFCVEYADRHVQVFWSSGAPEAAVKAKRWLEEALPRHEMVPENMLRSLIGSDAKFLDAPIRKEKTVERHGRLPDGGTIKLVYFKRDALTENDYRDAVETLTTWISSYFS